MDRRKFLETTALAGVYTIASGIGTAQQVNSGPANRVLSIKTHETKGALPHVWEECFGSDRAVVGLRQQWLSDLELVKKTIGMKSVRFHGLFNDEMGVWPSGPKQPNFLYVDMVFDAMLDRGIKPLVELSFMPGALASGTNTAFFYKGNSTPPKEMAQWGELIRALASHCIGRYGIEEVAIWNFEVWNEPNLKYFWAGTKEQYFELYKCAAIALKGINKRLKVGGPSTAQTAWVGDLLEFCASQQVPIDFASTHVYPDDPQAKLFGEGAHYPLEEVMPRALTMVRKQIKDSKFPDMPLYLTEWCSQNPAFIAHTIKSTIGLADMMSYWTFSNVFEEQGVPKGFLNNGFGLLGMRGVPRPSYYAFSLLHKLGDIQLKSDEGPVLATRCKDGSLAILVWNLTPQAPGQHSSMGDPLTQSSMAFDTKGETLSLTLALDGVHPPTRARITRVDNTSGDFHHAYEAMGSPAYPTTEQIAEIKQKSELKAPEVVHMNPQKLISVSIPPNGLALLEIG
jgi:xylan 1,4-beta-xylosidase